MGTNDVMIRREEPAAPLDTATDPSVAIEGVIEGLLADHRFVHLHRDPPAGAIDSGGGAPLPEEYAEVMATAGVEPFSHQVESLRHTAAGRPVVVATPTSSGKSLCYQVPALAGALRGATSMVIYPTKALAHDQLVSFAGLAAPGVLVAAYDGDCGTAERSAAREYADVVLTNPEMLHLGILSNHRRWDRFLSHLELVVVDELHMMRGVFGSHVAHLLRRLRRIVAARRGTEPTFVFTSATIGRPEELATDIAGVPVGVVGESGAPKGHRSTVLWNPFDEPPPAGGSAAPTASLRADTASIAAETIAAGLRTLVFCRSRRGSELVANLIRERLARRDHREAARRVRTYRGGYLPGERREIESALEAGQLDCVVATNALELGIDVAGIDAVVMSGFPGTISSFRQQSGRAGRGTRPSLVVLVGGQDQLDQWVMRHPREVFTRSPEPAVINPANPHVLLRQLACAADEMPLTHRDQIWWPDLLEDAIHALVLEDRLRITPAAPDVNRSCRADASCTESPVGSEPRAVWSGRGAAAPAVGLRNSGGAEFRIRRGDGTAIATIDGARVPEVAHPGAVYLHQGSPWRIVELDVTARRATAVPHREPTYTRTRSTTSVSLLEVHDETSVGRLGVHLGRVVVTNRVIAYEERRTDDHSLIRTEPLDLDPSVLDTTATWWTFPPALIESSGTTGQALPGALHAIEHAGIGIMPLFALCDRWDLGGVSTPWCDDSAAPTVVIHDAHQGGAGAAPLAFDAAETHLRATLEVMLNCECSAGCPSCVQSPKCGNGNEPLDKAGAIALLTDALLPDSLLTDALGPGDAP